jgi:hypothetical protein
MRAWVRPAQMGLYRGGGRPRLLRMARAVHGHWCGVPNGRVSDAETYKLGLDVFSSAGYR